MRIGRWLLRRWLSEFAQLRGTCHAHCLMSNHLYLLIETRDSTRSQGMRQLDGVFTQRSERQHHRVGHASQRRCKATALDWAIR